MAILKKMQEILQEQFGCIEAEKLCKTLISAAEGRGYSLCLEEDIVVITDEGEEVSRCSLFATLTLLKEWYDDEDYPDDTRAYIQEQISRLYQLSTIKTLVDSDYLTVRKLREFTTTYTGFIYYHLDEAKHFKASRMVVFTVVTPGDNDNVADIQGEITLVGPVETPKTIPHEFDVKVAFKGMKEETCLHIQGHECYFRDKSSTYYKSNSYLI